MEKCGKYDRFVIFSWIIFTSPLRMDCLMTVPSDCQFIKESYVCGDIPKRIPTNITDVVVTAFQGVSFSSEFQNPMWRQVKRLDLTGKVVKKVSDNVFATMSNLTDLTLRLPLVREVKSKAFAGLSNVRKLVLMDMRELQSQLFSALSLNETLPALEDLTFNPGKADLPPTVQILTHTAETMLKEKQIKSLNISNTLIITDVMAFVRIALSSIEIFNISGSTAIFLSPNGESLNDKSSMARGGLSTSKPLFKTFDISRSSYSNGPLQLETDAEFNSKFRHWSARKFTFRRYMTMIENFYADYIFHDDSIFVASYNYTGLQVFLKNVSCRGNNIVQIIGELILDLNNTIYSFDWSDNKIVYVQPGLLSTLIHLRILNFSRNSLHEMQYNPEFHSVFKMQRELTDLDLSYNKLSVIPFDMFDANANLELLNLSFNRLTTVMFHLMKLRKLKVVDLTGNHIQFIDGQYLSQLQQYIVVMSNDSEVITLRLNKNPLLCACSSVNFIEWLTKFSRLSHATNVYYCNYEGGSQRVDQSAVDKSKYLCNKKTIIAVSVSVSSGILAFLLVVACVFIKLRRKRKQVNRVHQFRQDFNGQRKSEEYIMFVAYASLEEYAVRRHLLTPINNSLKERLGTNRDTIATGYNFRPGFRISEETFRLIKLSHVFLAVVSNHFCRSEYCIAELHEACDQRKPVILVFNGEVDESDMSPYLREVFKRVVRAKMVLCGNGVVEIVPSVEKICDSVMLLVIK